MAASNNTVAPPAPQTDSRINAGFTQIASSSHDGPGIPRSQRDAVFGRFYRVEGGMASGSGLGLAIARELARLMGGDVTLASEAKPTVFVFDLPGEPVPDGVGTFSRENAPREPEHVVGR